MVGLLVAVEKTPLYDRLKKENRLVEEVTGADNSKLATNVIPKRMTYEELINGYRALHYRLADHEAIGERIRNKVRYMAGSPYRNTSSLGERLSAVAKLVGHVASQGGFRGLYHLFRSLPYTKPHLISLVARDWVVGLSARDYVERHFDREFEKDHHAARGRLERINRALARYMHRGSLKVALSEARNTHASFSFSMRGRLDRAFFSRAARELEGTLRHTRSSVTIRIEEFHAGEVYHLQKLLKRLHRYRDRIVIVADENSRRIIGVDSSVFNLAMDF
jgi:hypothetical protein